MKRSQFIKGILAATALSPGIWSCTSTSHQSKDLSVWPELKWRMVTTWPPNAPILAEGLQLFAQWIKSMTQGRWTIQIYGGGELVPALEVFEAVSLGGIELGSSASYYWAGKIPSASIFSGVPFGLNSHLMNIWMESGGGIQLWDSVYEPFNLRPFYAGNTNMQMGGWFNKEIHTMEDFVGLKMRMPGLGGRVLTHVGGTTVLSAGGEIYTNLERGVIDATEWLGPYHDDKMGFGDIARYYYYPGWHEMGTSLEMIANRSKFIELPESYQSIFESAIKRLQVWVTTQFEWRNAQALSEIKHNYPSLKIEPFSEDVIKGLKVATDEVLDKMAESDSQFAQVLRAYRQFKEKMMPWIMMSESTYYRSII